MSKTEQAHLAGQHALNPSRRCPMCWALAREASKKIATPAPINTKSAKHV